MDFKHLDNSLYPWNMGSTDWEFPDFDDDIVYMWHVGQCSDRLFITFGGMSI